MANGKTRKVLQFNEYDFRHKKVIDILDSRPRSMTELVVNAVLHYVSCPDASLELTMQSVRKMVSEALMEMQGDGSLAIFASPKEAVSTGGLSPCDMNELGGLMGQFRKRQ